MDSSALGKKKGSGKVYTHTHTRTHTQVHILVKEEGRRKMGGKSNVLVENLGGNQDKIIWITCRR